MFNILARLGSVRARDWGIFGVLRICERGFEYVYVRKKVNRIRKAGIRPLHASSNTCSPVSSYSIPILPSSFKCYQQFRTYRVEDDRIR
jgi:hypothetical protein